MTPQREVRFKSKFKTSVLLILNLILQIAIYKTSKSCKIVYPFVTKYYIRDTIILYLITYSSCPSIEMRHKTLKKRTLL